MSLRLLATSLMRTTRATNSSCASTLGASDGIGVYNAMMAESDGDRRVFCPPQKLGLIDAQYVAIMASFLTKYPTTRSRPVDLVLLFALKDAFPCGAQ